MNSRRAVFVGILAVALGEWGLYRARLHAPLPFISPHTPVSWQVGALFIIVGLLLFLLAETGDLSSRTEWHFKGKRLWTALLLVLAVSAITRFYRIGETPPGLWLDETDIAKQALDILRGARPKSWDVARLEVPWLYHYYVALFYKLLGPGYMTVKLPHLVTSILTAGMLYLLGRELLSEPFALFAALLWATMRWSVNMSRWGHANAMALFWYVTVLWLLWRALRLSQWRYWVAGGIALGLSQYTYQAARSLIPLTLLFILYWRLRVKPIPPHFWRKVFLLLALFGLVYAPLANTYIHHPNLFLERSRAISIFNPLFTRDPWATLRGNVGKYVGMFFYVGDPNGRHNIPGWPVVDPVTGLLLVAGLASMLRRAREARHVLLFLWIGAFLLAGILTTEAPNTFRVYGMTPVLALVAALGLEGLYAALFPTAASRESLPRTRASVSLALSSLLILGIAYLNLHTYFDIQATHPAVVGMFNVGPTKVGQYIATLPDDVTIYLDREFWAFSPIEVINPGRPMTRLKTPEHIPPPPEVKGETVYILGTYGRLLLPYLKRLYPRANVNQEYGPNNLFVYAAVRVNADDIRRRGLRVVSGEPAGRVIFPQDVRRSVTLQGALWVPRPGTYQLEIKNVSAVELGIGRELVITSPRHPVSITLPGGAVPVELSLTPQPGTRPQLLWRLPDDPKWTDIPQKNWYPLDIPAGGLLAQWYEGGGLRSRPMAVTHAPLLYADNAGNLATAAMRWTGYIYIDQAGEYKFGLSSDDGSRLWIDDRLVVDNWGLHGAGWTDGSISLNTGWHPIRIDYIDNGGSHWFEWRWAPPGKPAQPVPADVLAWDSDQVALALAPVPEPEPAIPVINATGDVVGRVPVAAAQLQDTKFNRPIADANFQKWPMKLKEQMYDHGIGVYGPGQLLFRLDGQYSVFEGMVGVDTDTYGDAHTQVQIIGDGEVLWDSGEIHPWDAPKSFRVDVRSVRELVLKQIEAGHFEGRGDAVDWVNIHLRR